MDDYSMKIVPLNYATEYSLDNVTEIPYSNEIRDELQQLSSVTSHAIPQYLYELLTSDDGLDSGVTDEWILRAYRKDPLGLSYLRHAENTILKNKEIKHISRMGFRVYGAKSMTLDQLIMYRKSAVRRKRLFDHITEMRLDPSLFASLSNEQIQESLELDVMEVEGDVYSPPKISTMGTKLGNDILSNILSMTSGSMMNLSLVNKSMSLATTSVRGDNNFWRNRVLNRLGLRDVEIVGMGALDWQLINNKLDLYQSSDVGPLSASILSDDLDVFKLLIHSPTIQMSSDPQLHPLLLAIDNGNNEMIVSTMSYIPITNEVIMEAITRAVSNKDSVTLSMLLPILSYDPKWDNSQLVYTALSNGDSKSYSLLILVPTMVIYTSKVRAGIIECIKRNPRPYPDETYILLGMLLHDPNIVTANMGLIDVAVEVGDVNAIALLLSDGSQDVSADDMEVVKKAIRTKNRNVVHILLSDRRVLTDSLIIDALVNGDADVVEWIMGDLRTGIQSTDKTIKIFNSIPYGRLDLLDTLHRSGKVNFGSSNNYLLRMLSSTDKYHRDMLIYTLRASGVDPADSSNDIVRLAVQSGNMEAVRILMSDSRVDISDMKDFSLSTAVINGNVEMVRLILRDSRVNPNNSISECFKHGREAVLKVLVSDSRAKLNVTHIMSCKRKGWTDIAEYIRNKISQH